MKLTDDVIEDFYLSIAKNDNNFAKRVHIPLSDVFYVREHLRSVFGGNYTLDYIEWALLKEGMIDPRHCFEPNTKLSWDEYPLEKELK